MTEDERTRLKRFLLDLEVELRNARKWELTVGQMREGLASQN